MIKIETLVFFSDAIFKETRTQNSKKVEWLLLQLTKAKM